jgi:hypothetical protein
MLQHFRSIYAAEIGPFRLDASIFGINLKHFQWLAAFTLAQAEFPVLHSCCSKAAT